MSPGYLVYEGDFARPWVQTNHQLKAVDVRVDEPLPDSLFKVQFQDGASMTDLTHDPPLRYRYRDHWPPEEWQMVLDEANAEAAKAASASATSPAGRR